MATVITGIQASGGLHLGNYLGAMRPMMEWQSQAKEIFFFIADLHALTTVREASVLRKSAMEAAGLYCAAGLDPKKTTLFVQSSVPAHSEAAWLLQCVTPMGELHRMTQFKQKRGTSEEGSTRVGLYTYPVLQAADILLYQADRVPVGEDQLQHLELARMIVQKFQHAYGEGIFTMPEPVVQAQVARIMSLDDPQQKMSKSGNPIGCLYLLDSPTDVVKKIKKAVTDTEGTIRYDVENKPGVSNLISIYHALSQIPIPDLESQYEGKGYGAFKSDLIEVIQGALKPIQESYQEIIGSHDLFLWLDQGNERAREIAGKTLRTMQHAMGVGPV